MVLLVLAILFALFPYAANMAQADDASTSTSYRIWQTDADWNDWDKNKVSLVGNNGGIELSRAVSGAYETYGEATYKFSPGGMNYWKKATLDQSGSSLRTGDYAWIANYKKDYVTQFNLKENSIQEEFRVGVDPSRTAVGFNDSVWVANRTDYVNCPSDPRCSEPDFIERQNTVSHIVPGRTPGTGKVYTKKIIASDVSLTSSFLRGLRSISVDSQNRVWVSMYRGGNYGAADQNHAKLIVFDGNSFDNDNPVVTPIATVDLYNIGLSAPYGSVFDYNFQNIYIISYSSGVYKISVDSVINGTGLDFKYYDVPDGMGAYGINNDENGDIWIAGLYTGRGGGKIFRIDHYSGNLQSFPADWSASTVGLPDGACDYVYKNVTTCRPRQVAVHDGKIFASLLKPSGVIAIADILGSGDSTSLGNFSFRKNDNYSTSELGEGIGFDSSGNIWQVNEHHFVKFDKSTNYQSPAGNSYQATTKGGSFYTYSDFIGNALANLLGVVEYSDNNINWYGDITSVPPSENLFIKIKLRGDGSFSPIIKSLKIEYSSEENPTVYIEKWTLKDKRISGTFQPGETIAVMLKVSTTEDKNVNVKIRDYLPPNVNQISIVDQTNRMGLQNYCGLSPNTLMISSNALNKTSDYVEWDNATIDKQDRYLCYTFEVPGQSDYLNRPGVSGGEASREKSPPKNDVFQVRAEVFLPLSNRILASSNNYIMIKGYSWATTEPTEALGSFPINDDDLAFSFTSALFEDPITSENKSLSGNPSYIYKRGLGSSSRGGTLLSLPVRMTNGNGDTLLSMEPFYLLYNPAFYIFGNIFSGSSSLSTVFDFNSKSNAVSSGQYNSSDKLNAAAALYNYFFDRDSVMFWDKDNKNNPQMQDNIRRILGSDIACEMSGYGISNLSGNNLYLGNQDCNIQQATTNQVWPSGRVWYFKPISDVHLGATIWETGTIIIDFSGNPTAKSVYIETRNNNFQNNSKLGLIVLNGNVVFTKDAERFDGLVFVPGSSNSDSGKIIFKEDGEPIKIHGSLVANQVQFAKRKNGVRYSVAIYSDSSILNTRLPGFERLMDIIFSNR